MSTTFDPDGPAAGDGLYGLPHTPEEARVWVLPVPFEATTSYRQGTAGGPDAVREASQQVDLCDLETGEVWRDGMVMVEAPAEIVALNTTATAAARRVRELDDSPDELALVQALAEVDDAGARVTELVAAWTARALSEGHIPAILGGDHSVPLGAIRAAAQAHPGLGVLHVDAHADLREAYEGFAYSHASIFHNVLDQCDVGNIVQVGIRDLGHRELARTQTEPRLHLWTDIRMADALAEGTAYAALVDQMIAPLPQDVWVSFDIDGLDPALCPNTGTPVPGGLSWREALVLLSRLGRSGRRIVGVDLCEVGHQEWDAMIGARLLYKLTGWAIVSQRPS